MPKPYITLGKIQKNNKRVKKVQGKVQKKKVQENAIDKKGKIKEFE